jgi:hypothetical protein
MFRIKIGFKCWVSFYTRSRKVINNCRFYTTLFVHNSFNDATSIREGSRGSVVGTATGSGLDCWGDGDRLPVGSRSFSSPRHQTRTGAHSASNGMNNEGYFPGSKAAGMWSWPLNSNQCRGEENVALHIHSPIRLHGVMLNQLSTGTTLSFTFISATGSI